jgi:hypothetical protein
MCGGDRDRAKSAYMYMRLRAEFPNTFAEANGNHTDTNGNKYFRVTGRDSTGANLNADVPMPKTFAKIPNTGSGTPEEGAALLFLILTEKGSRGEIYSDEAAGSLTGNVTISGTTYRVFTDTWSLPLSFARWATNAEIAAAPFTRPGATSQDPLDPPGKLSAPVANWSSNTNIQQNKALLATGILGTGQTFNGTNWVFTIVSAGPNKQWNGFAPAAGLTTVATDTDNILGYRLRRQGERGD